MDHKKIKGTYRGQKSDHWKQIQIKLSFKLNKEIEDHLMSRADTMNSDVFSWNLETQLNHPEVKPEIENENLQEPAYPEDSS